MSGLYGTILGDASVIARASVATIQAAITELSQYLVQDDIALVKIGEGELTWNERDEEDN